MRPRTLDELVGQERVLGAGRALRAAIESGNAGSLLLWGPPGSGKTTLAHLIAANAGLRFVPFSAVLSGIKEVREAMHEAERARDASGQGTLVFVDEIHRFNKAQQDAFLPFVEKGLITLVGATTENPSFSVISALLSRCRVVRLEPLSTDALKALAERALADEQRGLGQHRLALSAGALETLTVQSGGDARRLLNVLEAAALSTPDGGTLEATAIVEAIQHRPLAHDKDGDAHFDLLSALHKSLRNSDAQAAVYWLGRFVMADADPLQAARRMVAMAAEDIGLADPLALQVAVAAMQAVDLLGLPEGWLPLCEAAIYLAGAPKSNSVVLAIEAVKQEIEHGSRPAVPPQLRNAPTKLMESMGHGKGYRYAHDEPGGVAPMQCLPDELRGRAFYVPGERGFEPKVAQRLAEADRLRGGGGGGGA
jgi:putative ATPase